MARRHAGEVVAFPDAGHPLPEMWARLFPFVVWILDSFHTAGRLAERAQEVVLPGAAFEGLIAERTSQDSRWEERWPAPSPRPRALQPS
jgi:hypothetical protein